MPNYYGKRQRSLKSCKQHQLQWQQVGISYHLNMREFKLNSKNNCSNTGLRNKLGTVTLVPHLWLCRNMQNPTSYNPSCYLIRIYLYSCSGDFQCMSSALSQLELLCFNGCNGPEKLSTIKLQCPSTCLFSDSGTYTRMVCVVIPFGSF